MLLKFVVQNADFILRKKHLLRKLLIVLAPCLLITSLKQFELMSFESLHKNFVFKPEVEFSNEPKPFTEMSPQDTIFINFRGTTELFQKLQTSLQKMQVKSKYIKISNENRTENYFVKINLTEGPKSCYNVYPLSNYQPNSDLAMLARSVFKTKLHMRLFDLYSNSFEHSVDIILSNDFTSILKFCKLIRYLSNIHSFCYGLYYYIPLHTGFIRVEPFAFFCFAIILLLLMEYREKCNLLTVIIKTTVFVYTPCSFVLFYNTADNAILIFVFLMINLKFAFMFAFICYLAECIKEYKHYTKNKLNKMLI